MADIFGTNGDDQTASTNGTNLADTISLFSGDDQTRPGDGADTIFGGDGTDRVSYFDATSAVSVNLVTGGTQGYAAGDTYSSIEDVFGTAFGDEIIGSGADNSLDGYFGNDTIYAGAGQDTVIGGTGNDVLDGGVGNDRVSGNDGNDTVSGGDGNDLLFGGLGSDRLFGDAGNDILLGAEGNDTLFGGDGEDAIGGGAGADSINGGNGVDVISYFDNAVAVTVNLQTNTASGGDATGDTFTSIEGIEGSNHNDRLTGNGANNSLYGGAGADVLDGGAGADRLEGGLGNDFYFVDNAGDTIVGEVAFSQGGGIDTVRSFVDFVQPTNIELVRLGFVTDTDNLNAVGNSAPGTLVGNAGNNSLSGGFGNDQVNGNNGDDVIEGGNGRDTVVGGAGSDTFVYDLFSDSRTGSASRDVVNGFSHGFDTIDLSGIDANTNTSANDAFVFRGSAGFTGTAGELRTQGLGGANAVIVEGDIDGDGSADMQIFINLTNFMTGTDFIL